MTSCPPYSQSPRFPRISVFNEDREHAKIGDTMRHRVPDFFRRIHALLGNDPYVMFPVIYVMFPVIWLMIDM